VRGSEHRFAPLFGGGGGVNVGVNVSITSCLSDKEEEEEQEGGRVVGEGGVGCCVMEFYDVEGMFSRADLVLSLGYLSETE